MRAARQRKRATAALIDQYLTELEGKGPRLDPRRWYRGDRAQAEEAEIRYYAQLSIRLGQALLSEPFPQRPDTEDLDERFAWHDALSEYYRACMRRAGFPAQETDAWVRDVPAKRPRQPSTRAARVIARTVTAVYAADRSGKPFRPEMIREYEVAADLLDQWTKLVGAPTVSRRLRRIFAAGVERMSASVRRPYMALLLSRNSSFATVERQRNRDWQPGE